MPRSFYDMTKGETEAVDDLCRALVSLNYHASKAWSGGWQVRFTISEDQAQVAVQIKRDSWPSPDSETEEPA